jgi:predicted amidohydrolase YtcJ
MSTVIDRLITNGTIWTGTDFVEAVGIRGGRVVAVGPLEDVAARLPGSPEMVDLEGRTAIPGLIDSHIHFVRAALTWNDAVRWDGLTTLRQGLDRIRAAATASPPGTWLRVVGGWHPGEFAEGRGPTVAELNEVAPNHPVYVQLLYENAILNDAAMAFLPDGDPPGGTIERHGDGSPTGLVRGPGAFGMVLSQIPRPGRAEQVASTKAMAAELNGLGITGVVDPGGFGVVPETYRALFDVWRAGELSVRTRLYLVPSGPGTEVDDVRNWVQYVQPGFGDDMLRYTGFGEILSFGCHDMEGVRPWTMSEAAKAELREITTMLAEAGWPIHMHAIFDTTISDILDIWEPIHTDIGLPRTSFAHAEPISLASLERVTALGIGVAIQDRMIWRMADSAALWGRDIATEAPRLRDILDLGIPLGGGTDATVVAEIDPWRSIGWLVTGESVDGAPPRAERHRLSRTEALTAYTSGSAWFSLDEHQRGTLAPGMAADIAVLTADVFDPAEDLRGVTADLTLVGGRVVHAAGGFAGMG